MTLRSWTSTSVGARKVAGMSRLTRYVTYPGNVEHIVGEVFICPRLAKSGSSVLRWVATDAKYNADTDGTYVEFDGEEI